MPNRLKALLIIASLLIASPGVAAEWDFVGSWRVSVKCPSFEQMNNVTIGRADQSKIVGTTNVGDTFGKITAGQFDGQLFVFTNKYKFRGKNYTETWTGKLSNGGKIIRGIFDSTDPNVRRCSYRGSRV